MKHFADSPFWRAIAIAAVVALFAIAFRGSDAPARAFASAAYAQDQASIPMEQTTSLPGLIGDSVAVTSVLTPNSTYPIIVAVTPKNTGGYQYSILRLTYQGDVIGQVATRDIPNTK